MPICSSYVCVYICRSIRLKEISRAGNHVDGDHLPVMYILSLVNSMAWLSYGCLDPQSNAVVIINLVASVVHVSYTVWYICLCEHGSLGLCTGFALVVVLLFFGIMACIHPFFPAMFRGGHDSLNTPVTITAILMYIGPIPDMVRYSVCSMCFKLQFELYLKREF
jgi:hypothetical protein